MMNNDEKLRSQEGDDVLTVKGGEEVTPEYAHAIIESVQNNVALGNHHEDGALFHADDVPTHFENLKDAEDFFARLALVFPDKPQDVSGEVPDPLEDMPELRIRISIALDAFSEMLDKHALPFSEEEIHSEGGTLSTLHLMKNLSHSLKLCVEGLGGERQVNVAELVEDLKQIIEEQSGDDVDDAKTQEYFRDRLVGLPESWGGQNEGRRYQELVDEFCRRRRDSQFISPGDRDMLREMLELVSKISDEEYVHGKPTAESIDVRNLLIAQILSLEDLCQVGAVLEVVPPVNDISRETKQKIHAHWGILLNLEALSRIPEKIGVEGDGESLNMIPQVKGIPHDLSETL